MTGSVINKNSHPYYPIADPVCCSKSTPGISMLVDVGSEYIPCLFHTLENCPDMSKISRVDAIALLDEYEAKVRRLVPESKYRDVAIERIRQLMRQEASGNGPLSLNVINHLRLVKYYMPELTGKLGPQTVHELFTTAVHLLNSLQVSSDVQKAIKRARVHYDKYERRMCQILAASA